MHAYRSSPHRSGWGALALATAALTAAPLLAALPAVPAAAAEPDAAIASAGGITFPGTAPGEASATVNGNNTAKQITLQNEVLALSFEVRDSRAKITDLENKLTGETADVTTNSFFSMTLADGTIVGDAQASITGLPVIDDLPADEESPKANAESPGKRVTSVIRYTSGGVSFDLSWILELRDGANSVEQRYVITPVTGTLSYTSLTLLDISLDGARIEGADNGSPVLAGGNPGAETFFFGLENPMSLPVVEGADVHISLPSRTPVTSGTTVLESTGIGVSLPGQMRRSFQYYVERERAHARHTFLHYQSWYDLKPPGLMIDSQALTRAVEIFGSQLSERGAKIDSFWVDDGWDYLRSPSVADESALNVWSFDPTQFPNGFAPQLAVAETYGASMSVWMSPFGGYDPSASRRTQLNASKPADVQYERNAAGFKLSGPRYFAGFRDRVFDMIDNQGVRGFKFDGIGGGLFQSGPNAAYIADYEALLRLTREMRAHEPDVWINATVGTWGSPYWLWYVDSIWRDGHDNQLAGEGSTTQQYVTYRDDESVKNLTKENPLFPTTSLMNHGFVFSEGDHNPHFVQDTDLTKASVQADIASSAKAYFGLGLGLQELYVRHTIVAPEVPGADFFWDTIAANAKWARDNEGLLADSHFIGAMPSSGGVYGSAAWSAADGGKGTLMLRNPSATAKRFTIDVPSAFELPSGSSSRYSFVERDGQHETIVTDRYRPYTIELAPFEVLIFEAEPTTEPVTRSPFPADAVPIDRAGWTATTNTEQISGENGRAVNAIDGSFATYWHSQYSPSLTPFPHTITLDTGKPTTWATFDYVPRPKTAGGTGNGVIKAYKLEVSDDGEAWSTVASGEWTTWETQTVTPEQPVTSRYVRLTSTSAQNGAGYSGAAELQFWAPETDGDDAPTEPPSTIADPSADAIAELQLGIDGTRVPAGGELALADIPDSGWFHVALQPGGISLGWVRGDEASNAAVVVPAGTAPGDHRVVVQDAEGRLAGVATIGVDAALDVTATASTRCIAGKVFLQVRVENGAEAPADVSLESDFGAKAFSSIAPGKSATHTFTTRAASIPAGEVTVEVTVEVDGTAVSGAAVATYDEASCD